MTTYSIWKSGVKIGDHYSDEAHLLTEARNIAAFGGESVDVVVDTGVTARTARVHPDGTTTTWSGR